MKKSLKNIVYSVRASMDIKTRRTLDKIVESIQNCLGQAQKHGMVHTSKYVFRKRLAFN